MKRRTDTTLYFVPDQRLPPEYRWIGPQDPDNQVLIADIVQGIVIAAQVTPAQAKRIADALAQDVMLDVVYTPREDGEKGRVRVNTYPLSGEARRARDAAIAEMREIVEAQETLALGVINLADQVAHGANGFWYAQEFVSKMDVLDATIDAIASELKNVVHTYVDATIDASGAATTTGYRLKGLDGSVQTFTAQEWEAMSMPDDGIDTSNE